MISNPTLKLFAHNQEISNLPYCQPEKVFNPLKTHNYLIKMSLMFITRSHLFQKQAKEWPVVGKEELCHLTINSRGKMCHFYMIKTQLDPLVRCRVKMSSTKKKVNI